MPRGSKPSVTAKKKQHSRILRDQLEESGTPKKEARVKATRAVQKAGRGAKGTAGRKGGGGRAVSVDAQQAAIGNKIGKRQTKTRK